MPLQVHHQSVVAVTRFEPTDAITLHIKEVVMTLLFSLLDVFLVKDKQKLFDLRFRIAFLRDIVKLAAINNFEMERKPFILFVQQIVIQRPQHRP
jgi:hypothetical protein